MAVSCCGISDPASDSAITITSRIIPKVMERKKDSTFFKAQVSFGGAEREWGKRQYVYRINLLFPNAARITFFQ